jgi:hypothetical protein
MLPPLATITDLEARIGHPITDPAEQARANALLADASSLVRFAANQTWVDENGDLTVVPDLAVSITCQAALRGWFNPAGIEAAQLGAVSVRYGGAWLNAQERQDLSLYNRGKGLQQQLLKPGFGFDGGPYGYAPVDNNNDGATVPYADWFPIGY